MRSGGGASGRGEVRMVVLVVKVVEGFRGLEILFSGGG